MPGRKFSAGTSYRYGFNGKENDNEVKGEGNQIDYGMRVHDPRLGRFLSVDPYTKDYPWNTPYAYAENEPISNIDLDGLEKVKSTMSAAAAGAKQYAEEKKSQANGLLKLVTSTEPYRNLWGYAKDWGKAVTGDKTAIQNVNKKTTEVITQTSMAVANGVSQPTTFFSTMHTRSASENAQGLTYYGLQGTELYFLNRIFEQPNQSRSGSKVDLMGGEKSRYGGEYINYSKNAKIGIRDDVRNFKNHFGKNSISEIIVDNPQDVFLEHVTEALQKGGTITIRGNMTNKFFNKIFDEKAPGMEAFEVLKKNKDVKNPGYLMSDGKTEVRGQINEIILKKK